MERAAADLPGDLDDLVDGYFRDERLLHQGAEHARKSPDRRYPPLPPEYDGRLFDWTTTTLLTKRLDAAERVWPVVLELVRRAPHSEALDFIGAGVLEDFVNGHGPDFQARILEAAKDQRFEWALASVWPRAHVPGPLVEAIMASRTKRGLDVWTAGDGSDRPPR